MANKDGTTLCATCGGYSYIHEESVVPMSGNSIDYRFVREFSDETGANGKTTYEFSGAENLLEQSGFPYAQPIISTWRAGIPKFKRIFKKGTVRRQ